MLPGCCEKYVVMSYTTKLGMVCVRRFYAVQGSPPETGYYRKLVKVLQTTQSLAVTNKCNLPKHQTAGVKITSKGPDSKLNRMQAIIIYYTDRAPSSMFEERLSPPVRWELTKMCNHIIFIMPCMAMSVGQAHSLRACNWLTKVKI